MQKFILGLIKHSIFLLFKTRTKVGARFISRARHEERKRPQKGL